MTTRSDFDFDIWYNTPDPSYLEINHRSQAHPSWLYFRRVYEGKYADAPIKPINRYVEKLYPPPTLVSIEGNTVRLRQGNHAEFFLLDKAVRPKTKDNWMNPDEYFFKHLDRPHVRQYYNSALDHVLPEDCFPGIFKFYVPWIPDFHTEVLFEQPKDVWTPWYVYPARAAFEPVPPQVNEIEPPMVPFHFKKTGEHMVDDCYGRIARQTPMFDIVFQADDIIIKRIEEFYAEN